MNDLKQETERLLTIADTFPQPFPVSDMATHIRALQAENDRLTAECEALRAKSRAFRNRLTQEIAQNKEGEYELRQVEAEYQVNEFEQAFDAAMNGERSK